MVCRTDRAYPRAPDAKRDTRSPPCSARAPAGPPASATAAAGEPAPREPAGRARRAEPAARGPASRGRGRERTIAGATVWSRSTRSPPPGRSGPRIGERRLSTGTSARTCFSTSSATPSATAHSRYCSQMTTASAGALGRSEKSFRYVRNISSRLTRVRSSSPSLAWILTSATIRLIAETGAATSRSRRRAPRPRSRCHSRPCRSR